MKSGPDFIIIGAMKAATSTLHEQLALQPGICMSTPKEPCFFSDDDQWRRGFGWYASLFAAAADNCICGESSTHYTKLPTYPQTIERMRSSLSSTVKFIYIMRHPIDRLVSHYIHEWTQRVIRCPIDLAIDRHPELIHYSLYSKQLLPYLETFGPERVLPIFFDRLSRDSQAELERVCFFIGYSGTPVWREEVKEQNVSSERLRKCGWRDAVVNFPGMRTLRRTLVPTSAREWVKGFWTMKQRPELSRQNVERLTGVFDDDLQRLGNWLGMSISCSNFKAVTARQVPSWRASGLEVIAA